MERNFVSVSGRVMRDAVPTGTEGAMFFCLKVEDEDGMVLVDCVLMPSLFDQCEYHLDKDEHIGVEGKLTYRTWTDQLGRRRSGMEVLVQTIEFLEDEDVD